MNVKRTDLAIEARQMHCEKIKTDKVDGVEMESENDGNIKITRVEITNDNGSGAIMRPKGTYVTIETEKMDYKTRNDYEKICTSLKNELHRLCSVEQGRGVLVAGLGNKRITADALGPKCVEQMIVTRHLFDYVPEVVGQDTLSICAISPGVLGITGIETLEIIKGVCDRVNPGLVIVIDALAARCFDRINTTIQVTDTGISPGSGVGNDRKEISKKTLGCNVVAIGVPTVVDGATMAQDLYEQGRGDTEDKESDCALSVKAGQMVFTTKDVDIVIDKTSKIVANGLNMFLHDGMSLEEIESFAL